MNCVKCGAALEEGSASTLCPACQALETPTQEEKPAEPVAPTEPIPPVEPIVTPDPSPDPSPSPSPEPPAENPAAPSDEVPGGTL